MQMISGQANDGMALNLNNTQLKICDAFVALNDQYPVDMISIQQLCKRIPIARTTFYRYFNNICEVETLVAATSLQQLQALMQVLMTENDDKTALLAQVRALFARNWAAWQLQLVTRRDSDYYLKLETLIKGEVAQHSLTSNLHAEFIGSVIVSFLAGVLTRKFVLSTSSLGELIQSIDQLSRLK
ncbi:hypothetical protein FC83_GL002140 [Agrilactobacillus composti DSM 18527 = JCM 14202]|uniref:HTH tetR-type domain-containing protein n=1 Tax=Agrilactobacillus composti DSM 18527 = JCM 14202 TaxID=1423734 RepID=X0PT66_9LACO|nr:hypothetical protein [Agrilactobacillus composti]KRM34654.1 hypothetical protein FC83_GL002140 [Agrilactobacillus composti DSM 18527 = JCM 14202]GAF41177.1 hypothetical protein JCM14202_3105 [Agrilactobacillus composti DSM 18527 = JCM 14202]